MQIHQRYQLQGIPTNNRYIYDEVLNINTIDQVLSRQCFIRQNCGVYQIKRQKMWEEKEKPHRHDLHYKHCNAGKAVVFVKWQWYPKRFYS